MLGGVGFKFFVNKVGSGRDGFDDFATSINDFVKVGDSSFGVGGDGEDFVGDGIYFGFQSSDASKKLAKAII